MEGPVYECPVYGGKTNKENLGRCPVYRVSGLRTFDLYLQSLFTAFFLQFDKILVNWLFRIKVSSEIQTKKF